MIEGRCPVCADINTCPKCNAKIEYFKHVGVRASKGGKSSVWHYARPCGHRVDIETISSKPVTQVKGGALAVYNGGPVWKEGYQWFNIFWGSYWEGQSWTIMLDKATKDIESNPSYSGQLSQYNVGIGTLKGHTVITENPSGTVSNTEIGKAIVGWIADGTVPDLQGKGAYNVFLPPGITATLGTDRSCAVFCDYHDTVNGNTGPFFTCEPYPCISGCNQCSNNPFDTITQGLSEEMVELKTDMNPGTGWVIGNEEICDYCDANFVCNKISTGELVNAWYSDSTRTCWAAK